jgi:hypothetical protein
VIEEAHRLLKATPAVVDPEMASMAHHAVEAFCTMLAEIRAYGEGIVVVEQMPSKLAPEILKLTHLKIAHRLVAEDDRELMGGAMCAYPEQRRWLGTLRVGEAVVFGGGDDNPMFVRVPYRKLPSTTTSRQQDATVRDAMAACLAQHAAVYTPYPWAPLTATCWRTHRAQAHAIVEQREFQEIFACYVHSVALTQDALAVEFPPVAQTIRKYTRPTADAGVLESVLVAGIDWLFETRGQQSGTAYADVERLKQQWATLLLTDVLPAWRHGASLVLSAEHQALLATFQRDYAQAFACTTQPFAGCAQVCATQPCLSRYHVEALVRDPRLQRNVTQAITQNSGPDVWSRVVQVCRRTARRALSPLAPQTEHDKLVLCLLIQVGETLSTLDGYLKAKLITGVQSSLTPHSLQH